MTRHQLAITYIGGPTALIDFGGLRLLTDPTFDPAGGVYTSATSTLTKTGDPALGPESLGHVDAVLLSHDHHFDNLDHAGRALLATTERVLTTIAGAERLGGTAIGVAPWQSVEIPAPNGRVLRVTATPARHGPPDGDRGPVTGFVLAFTDALDHSVYVSGDTVWYEGTEAVAQRFDITTAVLFMGAARVSATGPALTMTANDGVKAAHAFSRAVIVPLHFEGWEHFTESREEIARAFSASGLGDRIRWPVPGDPTIVEN